MITSDFILVTFNEKIATVRINQVTIYPVKDGIIDDLRQIKLSDNTSFSYKGNTLEILIQSGDLDPNTQYRVRINQIEDRSGNAMVGVCQWDFTTIGAPAIELGKTGVCSSDPLQLSPGKPLNLLAVAGDGNVVISWQAPITLSSLRSYKAEKSIDNQQTFVTVKQDIPATTLTITDRNIQNDVLHTYRVSAENDAGVFGPVAISNSVTPGIEPKSGLGTPRNFTAQTANGDVILRWQAPLSGRAVDYYQIARSTDNRVSFTTIDTVINDVRIYTEANAKIGTEHVYRLIVGNVLGQGYPVYSNIVTPTQ